MTTEKQRRFAVYDGGMTKHNNEGLHRDTSGYQTNPQNVSPAKPTYQSYPPEIRQKFLQFVQNQKSERFNVDDLLKW